MPSERRIRWRITVAIGRFEPWPNCATSSTASTCPRSPMRASRSSTRRPRRRYASSPVSGEADVDAAFAAAAAAFETWGETTPAERQLALFRIADAIEARAEEFADLESKDTGKPRASLVDDEIMLSVDQIRFFAGEARHLSGMATAEYMKDHTSSIRREPIGVIGQVTPWNYPLNMAVWKFAPAIAAGNTTVLKPSDTTPSSTLLLAEVAAEFLPPGVLNVITGDRTTGGADDRPPHPADGVDHGVGARGHGGREGRGIRSQARAPRARRQGAGDRLRRRRHRLRRRGHRRRRLLQRRAGLHGGHARARARERARRVRRRDGRLGQGQRENRRAGRGGHPVRGGQQREPARAGLGRHRLAPRQREGRARRQAPGRQGLLLRGDDRDGPRSRRTTPSSTRSSGR